MTVTVIPYCAGKPRAGHTALPHDVVTNRWDRARTYGFCLAWPRAGVEIAGEAPSRVIVDPDRSVRRETAAIRHRGVAITLLT